MFRRSLSKTNKRHFRTLLTAALSISMIFSVCGCGRNDVKVEDYGGGAATSSDETDVNSNTDPGTYKQDDRGLRDFFGKEILWNEDFTVQGKKANVYSKYIVPNKKGLDVFHCAALEDGKDDEDKIVKALFGDTAEKLKEIKYTNETDYITFLYKLRNITNHSVTAGSRVYVTTSGEESEDFEESLDFSIYDQNNMLIDSSFSTVYKWMDNPEMYVHFYKGKYNGIDYGLILGYDYTLQRRYIFFDPISIKDVYPDADIKSIVIEGSNSVNGLDMGYENECSLTPDEVKDLTKRFLTENLYLNERDCDITNSSSSFDNYMGYMGRSIIPNPAAVTGNSGENVLGFSNADYISTIRTGTGTEVIKDCKPVAEQRDFAKEGMEKYDVDYYTYMNMNPHDDFEKADIKWDGYAVFLQSPFDSVDDDYDTKLEKTIATSYSGFYSQINSHPYTSYSGNAGVIKVNSKGLYGVDLEMSSTVLDVTENVKLLEFDKIKECVKTTLENFNPEDMKSVVDIHIQSFNLSYLPVVLDESKKEFDYVPCWTIGTIMTNNFVVFNINAIDGTLIQE